jgi:hypothetical protein
MQKYQYLKSQIIAREAILTGFRLAQDVIQKIAHLLLKNNRQLKWIRKVIFRYQEESFLKQVRC